MISDWFSFAAGFAAAFIFCALLTVIALSIDQYALGNSICLTC